MSIGPRHLNRYELQTRLGRGGMAEVWKAFDPQLQRHVAIKMLHTDLQNDPSFIARFEREAQLIASLHHHNIVQIYDFHVSRPPETDETVAYMVMDYVEGTTLSHYLRNTSHEGQFLSPIEIVSIFTPICRAVDYAHKKGMIHRDLKPANILLDKRNSQHKIGEPILSDFGIAKLLDSAHAIHSGWWPGTPHYTSPEQANGEPGNERSDIYALAIILYEMCVGTLPFQGDHPTTIMMQHMHTDPIPPLLINPAIQPALAAVILRGLAKDPTARFPDASTMGMAVAEALNVILPPELPQSVYQLKSLNNSNVSSSMQARMTPEPSLWAAMPAPLLPGAGISTPISASSSFSNLPSSHGPTTHNRNSDTNRISIPYSPLPIGPTDSEPTTDSNDVESVGLLDAPHPLVEPPLPTKTQNIPSKPTFIRKGRVKWRKQVIFTILIALALMTGSLSTLFLLTHQSSTLAKSVVVGNVFFTSSGLLNGDSSQGINDEIVLDLHNVSTPQAGKAYYGWLLSDRGEFEPAITALGPLHVNAGNIHFLYKGTAQHANLLMIRSRILITEEDASVQPVSYSPDYSNWAYYGQIAQTPSPKDRLHFSMLDHLRHLLSDTPELTTRGLHGGLAMWFLRNTEAILDRANGARDSWKNDPTQLRSQVTGILDYLDGKDAVQQDIPKGLPKMTANPSYVQIPLLGPVPDGQDPPGYSFAHESPPGYVYLISSHLAGTVLSPDATPDQRDLAAHIQVAIDQTRSWLEQVHQDAKRLIVMNNDQLGQPLALSLLDDMVLNAQYTSNGQVELQTGQIEGGTVWIYSNIQRMASFEVKQFDPKTYTA